jgi:hypothetical protein
MRGAQELLVASFSRPRLAARVIFPGVASGEEADEEAEPASKEEA